MINHQYTKSFEFEKDFHLLLKRTVHPDIEYFSMLKPLYEIQISKICQFRSKWSKLCCVRNEIYDSGTKIPLLQ